MNNTVRSIRGLAFAGVASLGLIAMTPAMADSEFDIGNSGTLTAEADLNFEIVIPRFLYLQVGTAGAGNVDTVSWDLSTGVTDIGDIDGTIGTGSVTSTDTVGVRLVSNAGAVDLSAAGSGTGLVNADGDIILWSEISGTAANGTGSGGVSVPAIGAAAITVPATTGVVNRTDTWSFDYANSALVAGGTYEGTVTYTATSP